MTVERTALARMAAMYEAGWSNREIAEFVDGNEDTIRKQLKDFGVVMRPTTVEGYQKLSHADIDAAVDLYVNQGMSLAAAGKVLGIHGNAVKWRLRLAGVELRTRSEAHKLAYASGRKRPRGAATPRKSDPAGA